MIEVIGTALLMGAFIVAGVGIVATFWNDLVDFAKDIVQKAQKVLEVLNRVVYGVKVFLKKIIEGVQEIVRHYSYSEVDKQWQETTTTRTVSENEVPEEIRNKLKYNREEDFTQELKLQITN